VDPVAIPHWLFRQYHTRHSMRTVFVLLVVGLFTHFIFLSRRGAYNFAHVFFSFLHWWFGTSWQALGKCCGGVIMDQWQPFIGIDHITGWSVGDQVRQVAPPSQQANLDVIICQDDVMSKEYCCFRIPKSRLPINRHETQYVHLLLAHFCIPVSDWLTLTFDP